jgi:hypothetical protein
VSYDTDEFAETEAGAVTTVSSHTAETEAGAVPTTSIPTAAKTGLDEPD